MAPDTIENTASTKITNYLLGFLFICAIGVVMRLGKPVLIPLTIAILFSFLCFPLVQLFAKWKIPRIITILIIMCVILAIGFLFGLIFFSGIRALLADVPRLQAFLTQINDVIITQFSSFFPNVEFSADDFVDPRELLSQFTTIILNISNTSLHFLQGFLLALFFLFFILLEEPVIRRSIKRAIKGYYKRIRVLIIFERIYRMVVRYLSVKMFISFGTALLVLVIFLIAGIPNALLWMLLTFLFNFIPVIGSIVVSLFIFLYALIQLSPNYVLIVVVCSLVTGVQLTLGNVIEPKIMGEHLNLNPFVILLALVSWGLMWGIPGMLLAVPLTVFIKIILGNTRNFQGISILMEKKGR